MFEKHRKKERSDASVTEERPSEDDDGAMIAIRSLVEANHQSMGGGESILDMGQSDTDFDADVLTLDDIVWRSPSRQVIDSTDIITHLAEEADRVAKGTEARHPPAAILPRRDVYQAAVGRQTEAPTPDRDHRRAPRFQSAAESFTVQPEQLGEVEDTIRGQITANLRAEGKVDADGKVNVSEQELRRMVRAHIDAWLKQQSGSGG